MRKIFLATLALLICTSSFGFRREARLVRYPHYHDGRIVFRYLGADENGQNVQRLTVNPARDVYGRFSPTGGGLLSPANATATSTLNNG